jgi:outer membrane protein TolC
LTLRRIAANGATYLCVLSACATSYLSRAPPSPSTPWRPATADAHDFSLPPEPALPATPPGERGIEAQHVYSLPELIDIAESANPDTRIAWEQARQAALAVGLARAEYLPTIAALALAGYRHTFFPVPSLSKSIVGIFPPENVPGASFPVPSLPATGHVGVDTFDVLPFLAIRWQVVDFGRGAQVDAAENASVAANVAFTGAHQKVVLDVTKAYLGLSAARAQVAVARDALERTSGTAKATEAQLGRGLATTVEATEARREVAQAEYGVSQAQAAEVAVYTQLLAAMGLDPLVQLKVATNASRNLPGRLEVDVNSYVQAALKTRPDLQAALAQRASAQALVSKSEAASLPRMGFVGTAGAAVLGAKIDGGPFSTATLPNLGASLTFEWSLFDFGFRDAAAEIARSRRNQADQLLEKLQREATHQVVAAYHEVNAALARYHAASSLERTAATAEDAATKSHAHGLATITDVLNAQKARSVASAGKEQAFANALISATALVFASGQLGSANAVPELK